MTAPEEVDVGGNRRGHDNQACLPKPQAPGPKPRTQGGEGDYSAAEGMTDRTRHHTPYAVSEAPVNPLGLKNCDPARKKAKVVIPPKVLKMGVNSPVTARIYA
jgi:hypothetical protein